MFSAPSALVDLSPAKDLSKTESPTAAVVKQDIEQPQEGAIKTDEVETEASKLLKNNLTEDKGIELMDAQEEVVQTEGKESKTLEIVPSCQTESSLLFICLDPCSRLVH